MKPNPATIEDNPWILESDGCARLGQQPKWNIYQRCIGKGFKVTKVGKRILTKPEWVDAYAEQYIQYTSDQPE